MQLPDPANTTLLFIHNKYLKTGGEDSVVFNEINLLRKHGYSVWLKEFGNENFQSTNPIKKILAGFNFFFNLSAFFSVYRLIKKHKIQVLHTHNFFYTASPAVFWAGKLAGAKTVMTIHNYRLFCLNALFYREGGTCMDCVNSRSFRPGIHHACFKASPTFSAILAASLQFHRKAGTWVHKVDRFIVLNPFTKELLQGIGVNEEKITVKSNFIADTAYADYRNRNNTYLYAGRIEEEKGIRHMMEAFQQSGRKLLIAGDGNMVPYVKENTSENIQYIGQQTPEQIAILFQQCKGFIFPSLLTEGMPMTLIEAFAAGAVSIAAASVNTSSMISDGVDGFLYEGSNASSLNRAIGRLEELDLSALQILSGNARKKYENHYHESIHLTTIHHIYTNED